LARALKAFHYAKELLLRERGDPRTVLAATLLRDVFTDSTAGDQTDPAGGSLKVKQILHDLGVDASTIAGICEILAGRQAGRDVDSIEYRLVHDAHALNELASQVISSDPGQLADAIRSQLSTEAAKQWAGKWLVARGQTGNP
jgi:hypothetical protein